MAKTPRVPGRVALRGVFILLASPLGLKPRFRPLVTPGKSRQEESETP